jgi:O-antigen/teichoic acid export membrane protein
MAQNPIKSLAGQTVVYGMGTILPRLLNYFMVPLYTRVFEREVYGQVTELYAYVAFFMVLLTYGMETAFFRYAQKHEARKVFNTAMSAITLTSAVFLVLLGAFYLPVSSWMQYEGNPEYILFIGLIVTVDVLTAIPFAMLRKLNQARRFAVVKLLNVSANIGLNLIFIVFIPGLSASFSDVIFGNGPDLLVWVLISNIAASILSLAMLAPLFRTFRFSMDLSLLRPMLHYALPVLVVGVAGMVNEVIDKILLKYLLPDSGQAMAQLGVYGANYKLGVLMTLFVQMFRYASEPFFFAEAEKKNAPELFARVMNYFVLSGLMIFLMVVLYLDLFKHFIGQDYHEGLGIVPIVLMANLFYGIFYNLSIWYKLTDRTGAGAYISIAGAIVTITLNILLIPVLGYHGAAWAHFGCYFLMMGASYIWGQKVFPIPYQTRRIVFYILVAAVLYFISTVVQEQNAWLKYSVNTFLFGLFTFVAYWLEIRKAAAAPPAGRG